MFVQGVTGVCRALTPSQRNQRRVLGCVKEKTCLCPVFFWLDKLISKLFLCFQALLDYLTFWYIGELFLGIASYLFSFFKTVKPQNTMQFCSWQLLFFPYCQELSLLSSSHFLLAWMQIATPCFIGYRSHLSLEGLKIWGEASWAIHFNFPDPDQLIFSAAGIWNLSVLICGPLSKEQRVLNSLECGQFFLCLLWPIWNTLLAVLIAHLYKQGSSKKT